MRQTILLADDSPTIQRLVNQTFADTRFDIVTVNNGDAAIRKFDEIEPDVVLADIYMPGKNGYEVCAHVRDHATLSGTPVILLVGAFDAFDEAIAKRAGASAHITKPFEPRALVELVSSTAPKVAKARKPSQDSTAKAEEPAVPETVLTVATVERAEPLVELAMEATEPLKLVETPPTAPPMPDEKPAEKEIQHAVEPVNDPVVIAEGGDLLGLAHLFPPEVAAVQGNVAAHLTEEEIDKIADRVIRKLSAQAVESIAWDVVPDIAVKILRDELKKTNS
jgi:CheY-like chemotaxis protein